MDEALGPVLVVLAISVLTQSFQEAHKYLTRSRAKTFEKALGDYFGPWTERVIDQGRITDLQARRPFQIRRVSPRGETVPFDRETVLVALERSLTPWLLRVSRGIRAAPSESPGGAAVLRQELHLVAEEADGELRRLSRADSEARDGAETKAELTGILEFIRKLSEMDDLQPRAAQRVFYRNFAPQLLRVADEYEQFLKVFEHSYQRRNRRQTLTIGILGCLLFNTPELMGDLASGSGLAGLGDLVTGNPLWSSVSEGSRLAEVLKTVVGSILLGSTAGFGAPFLNDRLSR